MESLLSLPIWGLALVIFVARICDVTVGTLRTMTVVQGQINLSVFLGFFEILIWISIVSQVVVRIAHAPVLAFAYAGGFAAGNATGILLERKLAIGSVIVRLISITASAAIAETIERHGRQVTAFRGNSPHGESTMVWAILSRRELPKVLHETQRLDPHLMYSVEPVRQWSPGLAQPLPHATGWRAWIKKK